jgi:hypothetical protein
MSIGQPGCGSGHTASSFHRRAKRLGYRPVLQASSVIVERLEDRQMLAVDGRLIGITGNQGNADYLDETLWEITYGTNGSTNPVLLDGFADVKPNAPDTVLSISTGVGVSQGFGALRVDVPQGQSAFWGFNSPNVVDALKAGATTLSYDMTLTNIELNGGSYGGGTDDSFNGFAQNNELAVVINTPSGGFIQRNFSSGNATDSRALGAVWGGDDGLRGITWDLTQFTSGGMSLADFITTNNATEARFWFVTQGGDTNGNTGPMRFYFDNIKLIMPNGSERLIGDFEPVSTSKIITLPFVPDTDSIAFNPENGLLYRASGASSYRDTPTSIGYNDNQYMQTVDLNSPSLGTGAGGQAEVFNANPQGDGSSGPYGLLRLDPTITPGPRPTWLAPVARRTPEQTDPAIGDLVGPGEYDSARDFTWSTTEHIFYVASDRGIYKLTADGSQSTFVGRPTGVAGNSKGIAIMNVGGQNRLLISERDGFKLWTIDPATGQTVGAPVLMLDANGTPMPGVLSLVVTPDGTTLLGIAKSTVEPNNPFNRDLVQINPETGLVTKLGGFNMHMADMAFVVTPALSVSSSEFVWQTAPHRLRVTFSAPIDPATLQASDLSIRKAPAGTPFPATDVTYDAGTRTATFTLSATPLEDGDYLATLAGGSVADPQGGAVTASNTSFFVYAGDANHDRTVNFTDLVALAQNYGQSGKTFPQGDFNYDGTVSFNDLVILAQKYGTTLPQLPAAVAAPSVASVTSAPSTSATKVRKTDQSIFNSATPIKKPAPAPKLMKPARAAR